MYPIRDVKVRSVTIPTDRPESDGTIQWDHTTVVIAEIQAGNCTGLGLTYASKAAATLIEETLRDQVIGKSALDIPSCWSAMVASVRNVGRPGIASMAISAMDFALWDLKAKLLVLPLHQLLGTCRKLAPVYGSGGFTSYTRKELQDQLAGWVEQGIPRVKMKVGREPDRDVERVSNAREAIGESAELFVDANGAYDVKRALDLGERFVEYGVTWFEEPVSSDDLKGLAFLRTWLPAPMNVAAGEYGFDEYYFLRMLEQGAVDVMQADATRCGGITGFLRAAALAESYHIPVSAHCAPSMHAALGCHVVGFRHLEYFHDHVRIERMLFDGVPELVRGSLKPDDSRPGFGLELKEADLDRLAA
ncbi:MAG: enolase C-terminal domain-like protein [Bdellovibrionia bacterium]